jgi:hypothetical protein
MQKTNRTYWYLAAVLAVLVLVTGCKNLRDAAQTTIDQLTPIVDSGQVVVANLQEAISQLDPSDPVRKALEEKLAKTQAVLSQANAKIKLAQSVLKSIESGEVSPDLYKALALVPYGTYIGLALSIGVGFYKSGQASKLKDAVGKIVEAWEAVGPELSAEDKAKARAIQGEKVTALVHDIKGEEVTPLS